MYSFAPGSMGTCSCAGLRLEIKKYRDVDWTAQGGDCQNMNRRQCWIKGLVPNTRYTGRMRIICANESLNSPWVQVSDDIDVVTLPGCRWSSHSGRQNEFECNDHSFCHMSNA